MVSKGKGKRRIIAFAALNVLFVVSIVLYGLLYDKITPLNQEVANTQDKLAKIRQEYETLSQKIENSKQNLSELSKENIERWFNMDEVKDED